MKRFVRWICLALFLLFAIAIIWFLHLFVQVDSAMSYITWDSSVCILPDGSEEPFSSDVSSNSTDLSGTYRFAGTLPDMQEAGDLVFETTGLSVTLALDNEVIWQSLADDPESSGYMFQAVIPLPSGYTGELTLTCEILDGTRALFSPLVRIMPENLAAAETTALANRAAFPVGAAALALVLVFGIFLLGIAGKRPDFSLIPLLFAIFSLILSQLVQAQGYFFLPEKLYHILARRETDVLIIVFLLLYLAANHRRRFWKYLGIAAAWSASALLAACLVSAAAGGALVRYAASLFSQLQAGIFSSLFYWITLWLALTSAIISAFGVLRSFTEQQVQTQSLLLKNKSMTESYQLLKNRMAERAKIYHEIRHQLTALDCLCQNRDYSAMQDLLADILREQEAQTARFTGNLTVNAILQDAAARAKQADISFRASVHIPDSLPIPEIDLCSLLMNMLDNALEGAARVAPPRERAVSVRIKISGDYLALRCQNTFDGKLKRDKNGNLQTTKGDAISHGFGCRQMMKIAEKYQSVVHFDTPEEDVFLAETALLLSD